MSLAGDGCFGPPLLADDVYHIDAAYRGSRIFSTVAPSSGAVVLSALKIFEGYQGNYSDSQPEINITTHRLLEATQFAYGQRSKSSGGLVPWDWERRYSAPHRRADFGVSLNSSIR